jgi:hypothetical protein
MEYSAEDREAVITMKKPGGKEGCNKKGTHNKQRREPS